MSEQRHNTDNFSILQKSSPISVIRRWAGRSQNGVKLFSSLKVFSVLSVLKNLIIRYCGAIWRAMLSTKAPLRRITKRDIRVLAYDRLRKDFPQSFVIIDTLECGHEFACLTWDVLDLLDGYTTNPEVRARRHRCRPCAELLAHPKPVRSVVPQAAKAGAA